MCITRSKETDDDTPTRKRPKENVRRPTPLPPALGPNVQGFVDVSARVSGPTLLRKHGWQRKRNGRKTETERATVDGNAVFSDKSVSSQEKAKTQWSGGTIVDCVCLLVSCLVESQCCPIADTDTRYVRRSCRRL
jgi:hypothetical protein